MGGSLVDFLVGGGYDDALGRPRVDLGLEQPPRRFTAGPDGTLDEGLTFAPDPDMAGAPIVRGGGEPGPVADSPALDQALLDAELRGRPLDPATGASIAPEGVDQPFTRPSPDLGDQFGMGLDEMGGPPQLEGPQPPLEGDYIPGERRPRNPQDQRPSRDPNAQDADILNLLFGPDETPRGALPPPQRRLPPPDEPPEP